MVRLFVGLIHQPAASHHASDILRCSEDRIHGGSAAMTYSSVYRFVHRSYGIRQVYLQKPIESGDSRTAFCIAHTIAFELIDCRPSTSHHFLSGAIYKRNPHSLRSKRDSRPLTLLPACLLSFLSTKLWARCSSESWLRLRKSRDGCSRRV